MGARRRQNVEFCCCAIPLVNFGAYAILLEHALIALCVIVLSLAPPSIVATTGSLPSSWPKLVLALLGVVVLLLQPLGAFAVAKEKPKLYRLYLRLTTTGVLITLLAATAFFAIAAARHSSALESCIAQYANTPQGDGSGISFSQTSSALDSLGETICNVWLWVQVGTMGGVLVLVGVTQLYMLFLQRSYGAQQRDAYASYKSLHAGGVDIPLSARLDDDLGERAYEEGAWSAAPARRGSDEYAYPAAAPRRGAGGAYPDEESYQPYPTSAQQQGYGNPYASHAQQGSYDSYGGGGVHHGAAGAPADGYETYGGGEYRRH